MSDLNKKKTGEGKIAIENRVLNTPENEFGEYAAHVIINNEIYPLILTVGAAKVLSNRYNGLENIGKATSEFNGFAESADEAVYLITLLANEAIKRENAKGAELTYLTIETLETFADFEDLHDYWKAISAAFNKGMARFIINQEIKNKQGAEA